MSNYCYWYWAREIGKENKGQEQSEKGDAASQAQIVKKKRKRWSCGIGLLEIWKTGTAYGWQVYQGGAPIGTLIWRRPSLEPPATMRHTWITGTPRECLHGWKPRPPTWSLLYGHSQSGWRRPAAGWWPSKVSCSCMEFSAAKFPSWKRSAACLLIFQTSAMATPTYAKHGVSTASFVLTLRS